MSINVFDCETYKDNDNNVIVYCISYMMNNYINSIYKDDDNDIFLLFFDEVILKSSKNKITFYIHNINFDGILILESVFRNNLKFKWLIRDLNIYSLTVEYLGFFIEFKCSYKFIPISLNNINLDIGKKKIFPYEFVKYENLNYIGVLPDKIFFNKEVTDEEYYNYKKEINNKFDLKKETIIYCENDVLLTYNLIKNIIEVMGSKYLNLFKKSYSAPSLSYKIFFKFWNNFKIKEKLLKEEDIYIRKSYYGGRCEVFGNPENDEITHYFDFSGMYSQCMEEKFPIGEGYFKKENLNYKDIGFHCIKYKSEMDYPILPYRSEEGKLIFSNGTFTGCYWYEEIELFVKNGGELIEIYSSYIFDKEDYVFKSFIEEFSKIRKKGGMYKIFGKLIINSLYGGFAMDEKNYESFICFSDKEAEKINEKTDVIEHLKKNECHILKILKNKKSNILLNKEEFRWSNNFSLRNVVYASIISSKARIKLYNAMMEVIKDNGRLFYCDTDSIAAGYKKIKINDKLGEITWQEIWKEAVFIAPKFYGYINNNNEEIVKIKGISKKEHSLKEIKDSFYKNESFLEYKNELSFSKKKIKLKQNYIKKIIFINSYNKRIFIENKKGTKPLNYPPYND